MKNFLVWIVVVMIFHLIFHGLRWMWNREHYFWFSIAMALTVDNFWQFKYWFIRFFAEEPVNEQ